MVVFWSIELFFRMNEGVHLAAYSEGIEVVYIEYVESCHEGACVGSGGKVGDESDDSLLCFV